MSEKAIPKAFFVGSGCNPPGLNHLALLEMVAKQPGVERVYFAPTAQPAHKDATWMAPFEARMEMARLLLQQADEDIRSVVEVTDIESRMPVPNYTIWTVAALESMCNMPVSVVIGPDYVVGQRFRTWHNHTDLLARKVGAVLSEPDQAKELMEGMFALGVLNSPVRSGLVRRAVANGEWESVQSMTGALVAAYLQQVGNLWPAEATK